MTKIEKATKLREIIKACRGINRVHGCPSRTTARFPVVIARRAALARR